MSLRRHTTIAHAAYQDLPNSLRDETAAIHKLIVADRRREGPDSLKAAKDRQQARFLIEALAVDRPEDLREAWEDAYGRGPQWRRRLDATLERMPEVRERLAGCGLTFG